MFRPGFIVFVLFGVLLSLVLLSGCRSRADSGVAEKYPHYAERVEQLAKSRLKVGDGDTFIIGNVVAASNKGHSNQTRLH